MTLDYINQYPTILGKYTHNEPQVTIFFDETLVFLKDLTTHLGWEFIDCDKWQTLGYMTYEVTSTSVICFPNLLLNSALIFLKSNGAMVAPGRPSILGLFLIICVRSGSGKPPTG